MALRHQIIALATLPLIVAILAITFLVTSQSRDLAETGITTFEQNTLRAKERELVNYIHLALSSIDSIYEKAGPDDEAAKDRVKTILANLSYGADGYFFVYDYAGTSIVHPRQPWRVGRNWLAMTDIDGDLVIKNLIDRAKEGGGFHEYKWEKPSSAEIADKLSYAMGLDKWQWMIGTGVYLDDVVAQTAAANDQLKSSIDHTFVIVSLITVPAVIAVFLAGILMNLRQQRLADTRLKALAQRVIDAQEEERTRIARELHDGISQNMIGVRYVLDLAVRRVKDGAGDALRTIEHGATELNHAIKEVRRISHDLRPGLLDDLGLSAALEGLTNNFTERTGIPVKLTSVAFRKILPADPNTALFRVAQEALANIERHANASRVELTITSDKAGLRMVISDDGRGFDRNSREQRLRSAGGLGLRNMQERLEHFGGNLSVDTSSTGTTLVAHLPKSIYLTQTREMEST